MTDDSEPDGSLLVGDYTYAVSKLALNKAPLLRLDEVNATLLGQTTVNEYERRKIERIYQRLMAELLSTFTIENASRKSLLKKEEKKCDEEERTENIETSLSFSDLCVKIAADPANVSLWIDINEDIEHFIKDHPKLLRNLTSHWRPQLELLHYYLSPLSTEQELLLTAQQWLLSPNLSRHWYLIWFQIYRNSNDRQISFHDLMDNFGSGRTPNTDHEDYRLAMNFTILLNRIETRKLTKTHVFYNYLDDIFRLDKSEQEQTRIVLRQKVMLLSSLDLASLIAERENQGVSTTEIALFAQHTLIVDCSLHKRDMHGKNLAIAADTIVIYYTNTVFDVSGICGCGKSEQTSRLNQRHQGENQKGNHGCVENCGNLEAVPSGNDGRDGRHGKAGESSGNIAIVASKLKNGDDLTVRLIGGNGEGGQDGGQGGSGVNGKGVSEKELDALCVEYTTMYWGDLEKFKNHEPRHEFVRSRNREHTRHGKFFFVNTFEHSSDGRKIEFSMAEHTQYGIAKYDLYFLVKGGAGQPSGAGGRRGIGGDGGRHGEFINFCTSTSLPFSEIKATLVSGDDGHDGINGREGLPGKNGNDMVMIDRSDFSPSKKYIGLEGTKKIGVQYHDSDRGMTRLNGFLKYEQRNEKCFVEFTTDDLDNIPTALVTGDHLDSDMTERAQSQCKQTIVMEQLLNEFQRRQTRDVSLSIELRFETDSHQVSDSTEGTAEEAITILRNRIQNSRKESYLHSGVDKETLIRRIYDVSGNESSEILEKMWLDVFKVQFDISPVVAKLDRCLGLLPPEFRQRIERDWKDKKTLFQLKGPIGEYEADHTMNCENCYLQDVTGAPLSPEWSSWNSDGYKSELLSLFMDQLEKYYCHSDLVLEALKGIQTALGSEEVMLQLKDEVDWNNKEQVYDYFSSLKSSRTTENSGRQGRRPRGDPGDTRRNKVEAVKNLLKNKEDHHVHSYHADLINAAKEDREFEGLLSFQPHSKGEVTKLGHPDSKGEVTNIGNDLETLIFIFFHSPKLIKLNDDVRHYYKAETAVKVPGGGQENREMNKAFLREFLQKGIHSIGYLHLLAEIENIAIEIFVPRSSSSMRRHTIINKGKTDVRKLFFTVEGVAKSIVPHTNCRLIRTLSSNCISPDILKPESESLAEFVHPSEAELIKFWSCSARVVLDTRDFSRLLRRYFELSGPYLTHVELIFVMNTCMDLVCNHGVPLQSMMNFISAVAFKNLPNWMLKLRMLTEFAEWTWNPKLLDRISDGHMSAILGSRLHEVEWSDFADKLETLVKFLSDSSVSFKQLEHLSLDVLCTLSADHQTTDFTEIQRKFGHLAYYIAILRRRDEEGSLVENFIGRLKIQGTPILTKTVGLLTYLMCSNEHTFGVNEELREVLKLSDTTSSERLQIASEADQQARISELRQGESWKVVFPDEERSLEKIGELSANNDVTKQEMDEILRILTNGDDACVQKLNEIDDVIFKHRKIHLRNTQKIAILCGYLHEKNLVSQVVTGEGKTLIIVVLSILYITLRGKNVDVITSSSVLAKRDAHDYKDVYGEFGISVDHNCEEDLEVRKYAYAADIVYGDVAHFERDFLLHFYYQKNVLGKRERTSSIAIVDEVDSMLLDHGSNMLYLSHNVTGLEMLEPLYVFIHKFIESTVQGEETVKSLAERIKKAVLMDVFGLLTKADIQKLDVSSQNATYAWNILTKYKIVDNNGVVLAYSIETLRQVASDLKESVDCVYAKRILGLLSVIKERKRSINIPGYLRDFAVEHLDDFVDSAIKARLMKKNDEYVIDVDRTQKSVDLYPVVTIIDKGTGTDLSSSQWTNGLHQFLQIANGCRVTPLSLKAVFISNVTFLKGYGKINGLSGTLGSEEERKCLKELYDADVMRIPTCKRRMFAEDVPVVAHSEDKWIESIYESTKDKLLANRSVLIICSSINDVDILSTNFPKLCKDSDSSLREAFRSAQTYRRDIDDFQIEEGGLGCGKLIISTNLAGRGTDIKLCEELQSRGGLHVIIGLCDNQRIEDQAFGRAARCGDYGSGQIIALAPERGVTNIFALQKQRNLEEQKRLRSLKNYYEYHINIEEECLKLFMEHCKELLKLVHSQDDRSTLPAIKYFALLDIWALELDRLSDQISVCEKSGDDEMKLIIVQNVANLLQKFDLDIEGTEPPNWIVRPQPLLHNALRLLDQEQHNAADQLFHRIGTQFPDFAGEAFYYLGALLQRNVRQKRDFRRVENRNGWLGSLLDFREDVQYFVLRQLQEVVADANPSLHEINSENKKDAVSFLLIAKAEFLRRMEREAQMCATVMQLHGNGNSGGYRAQKQEAISVWGTFVETIDRILGKHASNNILKEDNESEEMGVVRRKMLTHAGILSPPVLQDIISRDHLMRIAQKHLLPLTALKNLLLSIQADDRLPEYEGRRIVDIQLLTRLPLPNAVEFWGCLQSAGAFSHERKYLAVKKGVRGIPSDWKTCAISLGPLDIRLNKFYLNDFDFYRLSDLTIIEKDLNLNSHLYMLMSAGLAHIETIGTVTPLIVLKDLQLDRFDFISSSILKDEMGLAPSEAEWILTKLLDKGVLEIGSQNQEETRFVLKKGLDFNMFPESMQDTLWTVFTRNFSYGYALKWLKSSVKDLPKSKRISYEIPLASSPYSELHEDLISSGILVQSRVTSTLAEYKDRYLTLKKKWIISVGKTYNFLPIWLYKNLEPLSATITDEKCSLESTHKYMMNQGISSCTTLRNAISNGLSKVACVDSQKTDFWQRAVVFKTMSCLLTTKLRFDSSARHTFTAVEARVGTGHYFMEMTKANQKEFAGLEVSFEDEFKQLKICHQEAVDALTAHLKHSKKVEAAQQLINERIKDIKNHILRHSLVTDSKDPVKTEMFTKCVQDCGLRTMLEEFIESYMLFTARESLVDILNTTDANDINLSELLSLPPVIAFARAVVVDVNKWIRSSANNEKENEKQLKLLNPEDVRTDIFDKGISPMQLKNVLLSQDDTLQSVLAKKLHHLLEHTVDSVIRSKVQPMINKMIQSWAEEGAPSLHTSHSDQSYSLTEDAEEEELTIQGRHPYLFRDLYNIFLKLTFREQKADVVAHMVKFNFPIETHCALLVTTGVVELLHHTKSHYDSLSLILKRDTVPVFTIVCNKTAGGSLSCQLELKLEDDCFFAGSDIIHQRADLQSSLYLELKQKVSEIAKEYPYEKEFLNDLSAKMSQPNVSILKQWNVKEEWMDAEKLRCAVKL